jgi:PAS domain S-box-containing protein
LDFIAVINSDGSVRYESPSVERVLGYRPEERIGKSGLEHIHPEDMSEAANLLVRLVETPGTTVRVQSRFRHKDGSWRVLDVVAQNLLDNPAVAGVVANMRDVTEQKKAEEGLRKSEHNYRVLFESRIDGAAVIDAEMMKVVLANETAAKMYGFDSMEEVVEANLVDYVHPDDRERALTTLAEDLFEKDLRRVEEFRTLTKDGGVRWIAGVGTRVEYQGRLAGLISFRDITEQKLMDEKLRELYEQERESRQQLEAEMKKRVEFTRALAHELKTPLTSVLASSDLLESELREEPLQTLARSIRQGASNLNSRIDELLDLARGEVGMLQLKLEWVDMSKLLRETAESMIPLASRRGQSLVIALPLSLPPVRADAARLQQIVANLLSNALKFTPVGGNIKLGAKQKDAALVVEVRDVGHGIPKEDQKFLFEPYHRLQTEPSRGLGLGLALCRMLVELHGGQIWVRSQVGKGSTFGFSLPLETADKQAEGLEKPPKLWTVLIIEDDQNIVSTVSVAFQMRWPEAELVSTVMGEEGLHLVETENPDLVILDLGLPDIDGFDVLRRLRLFSSVPVVILTVRGDETDKVKGIELGADDYVVKPFKPQELLTRLKAQLRKSISP